MSEEREPVAIGRNLRMPSGETIYLEAGEEIELPDGCSVGHLSWLQPVTRPRSRRAFMDFAERAESGSPAVAAGVPKSASEPPAAPEE